VFRNQPPGGGVACVMPPDEKPHTTTATEARQGQMMNMTRWVLLFGLILVIIAFALAWIFTNESPGP
jgi:hypothetical protein